MSITEINAYHAVAYLVENEALALPENAPYPFRWVNGQEQSPQFTESQWDNYDWNPPTHVDEVERDPNASPKPTWAEMVEAYRKFTLNDLKYIDSIKIPELSQHRTALTDAATIEHEGESLYVGAGLDHMTGLLQMAEQADAAGDFCPHIVMRDGEQNVRRIYRGTQVRQILKTTAARENMVESAHNIVMAGYHTQAKTRDDDTQSLDDRETAATAAQEILDNYQTRLQAEMDKYHPDQPPPRIDLPEYKKFHAERLEAIALGKSKELTSYTTNQGVMLHPSCFDQQTAQQQIAVELQKGLIAINKASSGGLARHEYQEAGSAINAIEVINTPVFTVNQLAPSDTPYPLDKLLVTADHPGGEDIPGEVDIIEIKLTKGKLKNGFPKYHSEYQKTKHSAEIQIETTEEARIVVRARNVCGVARLIINMKPV